MWINNEIFKSDLSYINDQNFIDWDKLSQKTIFITGGTGLIGYYFICSMLYRNFIFKTNTKIISLVRDIDKAKKKFSEVLSNLNSNITFIEGNLENMPEISDHIDYILHAGGPTSSLYFSDNPVETITTIVNGSEKLLKLARKNQVQGMCFLSTMEVYGASTKEQKITESAESYVDTMVPRNSYPEAKRLVESLCTSYCKEYGVKVNVLRLTQTFGPGISANDNRVFAQFIRCAKKKENIVLLTEGRTKRSYLYVADAVTAILAVLMTEHFGLAFNAANESTYCSIKEMAEVVAKELVNNEIMVVVKAGTQGQLSAYMPTMNMDLDTSRLKSIGWKPGIELKDMFARTMKTICQQI